MTECPSPWMARAVLVGAPGVGKTTLAKFWSEQQVPRVTQPTTERSMYKLHADPETGVEVWVDDVGGTDLEDEDVMQECLSGASGVILVCDAVRRSTVDTLRDWAPRIRRLAHEKSGRVLIVNKGRGGLGTSARRGLGDSGKEICEGLAVRAVVELRHGFEEGHLRHEEDFSYFANIAREFVEHCTFDRHCSIHGLRRRPGLGRWAADEEGSSRGYSRFDGASQRNQFPVADICIQARARPAFAGLCVLVFVVCLCLLSWVLRR